MKLKEVFTPQRKIHRTRSVLASWDEKIKQAQEEIDELKGRLLMLYQKSQFYEDELEHLYSYYRKKISPDDHRVITTKEYSVTDRKRAKAIEKILAPVYAVSTDIETKVDGLQDDIEYYKTEHRNAQQLLDYRLSSKDKKRTKLKKLEPVNLDLDI